MRGQRAQACGVVVLSPLTFPTAAHGFFRRLHFHRSIKCGGRNCSVNRVDVPLGLSCHRKSAQNEEKHKEYGQSGDNPPLPRPVEISEKCMLGSAQSKPACSLRRRGRLVLAVMNSGHSSSHSDVCGCCEPPKVKEGISKLPVELTEEFITSSK